MRKSDFQKLFDLLFPPLALKIRLLVNFCCRGLSYYLQLLSYSLRRIPNAKPKFIT